MPSSPYLPSSAAYLKESSLLLQAYPDSTLITTKYAFPSSKSSSKSSKPSTNPESTSTTTSSTPLAALVLKTYNPTSGICLKYRTNKAAEVGRLITALGLLAGGADISLLDGAVPAAGAGAVGGEEEGTSVTPTTGGAGSGVAASIGANTGAGVSKGKGKGKGKKGKK
ncbi:signal recognition particle 9 kDa protein-domain-containing protein [Aspergillus carlsbadensis]|nr:signal recognition particle 9 kDa protein-domain-containing protein [Aspergillus carlsbadensis]